MKVTHLKPFDPRVIFVALWSMELLGHALSSTFRPLSPFTWLLVGITVGCFLVGAIFSDSVCRRDLARAEPRDERDYERWVRTLSPWLLVGVCAGSWFAVTRILGSLGIDASSPDEMLSTFPAVRYALINDFVDGREATGYVKILFAATGLVLYMLCFARGMSRWLRGALFAVGIVVAVLTTGRLTLLLFCLGAAYVLHSLELVRGRGLLTFAAMFVAAFLGLALALGKGDDEAVDVSSRVAWNLQVYALGSVAAFDHYVRWDEPHIAGGALLPNPVRSVLDGIIFMPPKPSLNPFVETASRNNAVVETNTFTALFPVYHDLGVAGLAVVFFLLGAMHQALYRRQEAGGSWWRYAYALSLYPLAMTVFEEAYVSSPGFWLTLLAAPLSLRALYPLRVLVPVLRRPRGADITGPRAS